MKDKQDKQEKQEKQEKQGRTNVVSQEVQEITRVQVRTQVRTRPHKPTCSLGTYVEDYNALVEYACSKEITLRQAFAESVKAIGMMDRKRAADRIGKRG